MERKTSLPVFWEKSTTKIPLVTEPMNIDFLASNSVKPVWDKHSHAAGENLAVDLLKIIWKEVIKECCVEISSLKVNDIFASIICW